jgi:hypothetical protein
MKRTKEQRARISRAIKASYRRRRKDQKALPAGSTHSLDEDLEHVTYALGRVEGWLEAHAERTGLPLHSLTQRVASLLLRKTSRRVRP